jgi:hypothetical protein
MNLISRDLSLFPPYKAALQYTLPHHKPSSQPLNDPRQTIHQELHLQARKENAGSQMMAVM